MAQFPSTSGASGRWQLREQRRAVRGDNWTTLNSFESIAGTVVVGAGGQATVVFSNLPQNYKHLQVRAISRTTFAGIATGINARFNSDSGSNYALHQLYGDGVSAAAYAAATQSYMAVSTTIGSTGLANAFGVFILDILDYTDTNKNKTVRSLVGKDLNGSGEASLYSSVWLNTASVTTVTILPSDGSNFSQHSHFALYGIRG